MIQDCQYHQYQHLPNLPARQLELVASTFFFLFDSLIKEIEYRKMQLKIYEYCIFFYWKDRSACYLCYAPELPPCIPPTPPIPPIIPPPGVADAPMLPPGFKPRWLADVWEWWPWCGWPLKHNFRMFRGQLAEAKKWFGEVLWCP